MKKYSFFISISIILVTISSYYFFYQEKTVGHRIAIFYPSSHPAMDEIEQGFKETVGKQSTQSYVFDVFNANGNKTLLRAQAEQILQNKYDGIFTIGVICTQTIFELSKKRKSLVPIVFCAIDDPAKVGIDENSRKHVPITGNTIPDNLENQLKVLLEIKPKTKQLLFVYDPHHGSGLVNIKDHIATILQQNRVDFKAVEVFQTNEIQQKVTPMVNGVDVIMVYTDHTLVSGIDVLISLCNRYDITLYASDLNSGDKGAALSFGVQEYDHGSTAATKMLSIFEKGLSAYEVPITPVQNSKLKINSKTMNKQGLLLSPEELNRIKKNGVVII